MQNQILGHFDFKDEMEMALDHIGSMKINFQASNIPGSKFSLISQAGSGRSRSAESLPYSSTYSLAEPARFFGHRRTMLNESFTSLIEEPSYLRSPLEPQQRLPTDLTSRFTNAADISVELLYKATKSPSGTKLKNSSRCCVYRRIHVD